MNYELFFTVRETVEKKLNTFLGQKKQFLEKAVSLKRTKIATAFTTNLGQPRRLKLPEFFDSARLKV
jgi:hypothetical protein